MQTVSMVEILKACRTFADAGKLGMQNGKTDCRYRYDDGCRCSIGAVMSDETLAHLTLTEMGMPLNNPGVRRVFLLQFDTERRDATELQEAHDSATGLSEPADAGWRNEEYYQEKREFFFRELTRLETKYGLKDIQATPSAT